MSKSYVENGDFRIQAGLENATIAQPNDPTNRSLKLRTTTGGNLRGFVQPANDAEVLKLRKAKARIKAGNFEPQLPTYARLDYRQVTNAGTGEITTIAEFVYDDINFGNGPLRLQPGEVFLFSHLDDLASEPVSKGERAAFSGFAADLDGNLTTPAAWRREGHKFYGGDNRAFDLQKYLASRSTRDAGGADMDA